MSPTRLLALSFLLSAGCDSFEDVTVPANDDTNPTAFLGVWANGEYLELTPSTSDPVEYETHDQETLFVLVGAGMDSGGMYEVRISGSSDSICTSDDGESELHIQALLASRSEIQDGRPGDTVSNGLWTAYGFDFEDTCRDGYTLTEKEIRWSVYAEDIHYNNISFGSASIRYTPE